MTDETKSILMNPEVIAVDQDPLGREGTPVARAGNEEIWAKQLASGAVAVGLFNRGEARTNIRLQLSTLKMPLQGRARDLWGHQDVKIEAGAFSRSVPPHGVVFLRVE